MSNSKQTTNIDFQTPKNIISFGNLHSYLKAHNYLSTDIVAGIAGYYIPRRKEFLTFSADEYFDFEYLFEVFKSSKAVDLPPHLEIARLEIFLYEKANN